MSDKEWEDYRWIRVNSADYEKLLKDAERHRKARTLVVHFFGDKHEHGALIYRSGTNLDEYLDKLNHWSNVPSWNSPGDE